MFKVVQNGNNPEMWVRIAWIELYLKRNHNNEPKITHWKHGEYRRVVKVNWAVLWMTQIARAYVMCKLIEQKTNNTLSSLKIMKTIWWGKKYIKYELLV